MSRPRAESGFTLLELLVASGLGSLMMAIILSSIFLNQQAYHEDVVRMRIVSNLRSAVDIISMNIRQSGEHLSASFPAIEVTNGASGAPDTLTLRRGLISDILAVCTNITAGSTQAFISSAISPKPECLAANVTSLLTIWENERDGGSIRAYIYDRVTGTGEWFDYTGSGTSSGDYYLQTSPLQNAYIAEQSSIYLLEEYSFELVAGDNTLQVYTNGDFSEARPLAFGVVGFQVQVEMVDGTTLDALNASSTQSWKDIKQVILDLEGQEIRRKRTFTSSFRAGYFPRNVLSE